jgi:hypothetical protein
VRNPPVAWVALTLASIAVGLGVIFTCYQAPWPVMRIIGWTLGSIALSVPLWVGVGAIWRRRRREG